MKLVNEAAWKVTITTKCNLSYKFFIFLIFFMKFNTISFMSAYIRHGTNNNCLIPPFFPSISRGGFFFRFVEHSCCVTIECKTQLICAYLTFSLLFPCFIHFHSLSVCIHVYLPTFSLSTSLSSSLPSSLLLARVLSLSSFPPFLTMLLLLLLFLLLFSQNEQQQQKKNENI